MQIDPATCSGSITGHSYKAWIRAGQKGGVGDHGSEADFMILIRSRFLERRFWTTVKEFRINSLTPMTPEPEAESCPVREWLRSCELHGGSFIDLRGLGALMPEEEPESPEEVRSQRRRSLPNADE